jgi:ribonucleotide reductase class II
MKMQVHAQESAPVRIATSHRNPLSEFVFLRTYARWNPEEGRRELSWGEAVDRYVGWLSSRRALPPTVVSAIRAHMNTMGVLPSMRALWSAGDAADRDNVTVYNCAFCPIDNLRAFSEALYILMCGTGIGFSVEREFTDNLPMVHAATGERVSVVVEDSTEGWANALYEVLVALWRGHTVAYDVSKIRSRGEILKTKGGRASGPEPLVRLFDLCTTTVRAAVGRQLRPIEVHDIMCVIGEIVMVGGFRRAALISFSDLNDEEMRHAKDWSRGDFPVCRYMSNNSAYHPETPTRDVFDREWAALRASGSGERGLFRMPPSKRSVRRGDFRSNPCGEIALRYRKANDPWTGEGGGGQFCVSGDTPLITREGLTTIQEAVNRPVHIWNGQRWSEVRPFQTGIGQKLNRVWFSDGSYLDCTDYHRFSVSNRDTRRTKNPWREMTVAEIREAGVDKRWGTEPFRISQDEGEVVEDTYTLGAAVGDGWVRKTSGNGNPNPRVYTGLWGAKDAQMPVVGVYGRERVVGNNAIAFRSVFCPDQNPEFVTALKTDAEALGVVFTWCRESILQFLAGWLDADGTQCGPGRVRLYLSKESRARTVQLLLTRCGIRSSVGILAEAGSATNLGVRTESLFYVDITDCSSIPCHRLDTSLGHTPRFKSKFQTIRSIEELPGLHATFCFEEPERHMGVFGNTLTYQCNLSAAVMRSDDTVETMSEKVRVATWIGAAQASFTNFPYLRPAWGELCEEDRLLGVDITGQCDNPTLSQNPQAMSLFNRIARETAAEATAWLGINYPAAITCGKPSGNSSQLVDCASGFHPRYAPYYIRRVRTDSKDPLTQLLRDSGVPMHKENGMEHMSDAECPVWVVEFPVAAPQGAMLRNSETALQMLERYLHVMKTWCGERGHNQSITVYVRDHEWDEVGEFVFNHFDEITGVSFLPYSGGK